MSQHSRSSSIGPASTSSGDNGPASSSPCQMAGAARNRKGSVQAALQHRRTGMTRIPEGLADTLLLVRRCAGDRSARFPTAASFEPGGMVRPRGAVMLSRELRSADFILETFAWRHADPRRLRSMPVSGELKFKRRFWCCLRKRTRHRAGPPLQAYQDAINYRGHDHRPWRTAPGAPRQSRVDLRSQTSNVVAQVIGSRKTRPSPGRQQRIRICIGANVPRRDEERRNEGRYVEEEAGIHGNATGSYDFVVWSWGGGNGARARLSETGARVCS